MANICSTWMELKFNTAEQAEECFKEFKDTCEAIALSEEQCIFDNDITLDGNRVTAGGWCKWMVREEPVKDFWKEWKAKGLKNLFVEFEECGCGCFGNYFTDNGRMKIKYLAENDPVWDRPDDEYDSFYEELEKALDERGILEILK